MPNSDTFRCPPIRSFVDYYLRQSKMSVDPFARNFNGCTYTNDLNPNTQAEYNMTALDFLKMIGDKGISPDLVVFDPPYSLEQLKRSYASVGIEKLPYGDTLNGIHWTKEKCVISDILENGVFLHFGWHTNGMGKKHGFAIEEILIVAHGGGHHDTLCMAERRTSIQINLFSHNKSLNSDGASLAR